MTQSIFQQAIPAIIQMATDVGGEYLRARLRQSIIDGAQVKALTGGEAPPAKSEGCPYCAVTKHLAIAHRYLTRSTKDASWFPLYLQLALAEITEAGDVLVTRAPATDLETLRLAGQVHELEVTLSRPLTAADVAGLTERVWSVSDFAMTMAERYQSSIRGHDQMADDMERKIGELTGQAKVIDAEATVLP